MQGSSPQAQRGRHARWSSPGRSRRATRWCRSRSRCRTAARELDDRAAAAGRARRGHAAGRRRSATCRSTSPQIAQHREVKAQAGHLHASGQGGAIAAGEHAGVHALRPAASSRCGRATSRSALAGADPRRSGVLAAAPRRGRRKPSARDERAPAHAALDGRRRDAAVRRSWPALEDAAPRPARRSTRHADCRRASRSSGRRRARASSTPGARDDASAASSVDVVQDGFVDFTSLTLVDVSRHFGRRRALTACRCAARPARSLALLGPNGAGKSTLLSIAATLLAPVVRRRALRRASRRSRSRRRSARRIGMLGHDLYLYPELSAAENLRFFGRIYGLPDVERRVDAALERAGLAAAARRSVSGLLARHAAAAGARARADARAAAACCSTSRSPGSTMRRRRRCATRLRELRDAGCDRHPDDARSRDDRSDRDSRGDAARGRSTRSRRRGTLRDRYRALCVAEPA